MKKLLILLITFTFASELEVQGNLKVTGNIDAQNNPITNVGMPQAMTDAINGNVLQDALRDDGAYEYKYFSVLFKNSTKFDGNTGYHFEVIYREIGDDGDVYKPDWITKINTLSNEGWHVSNTFFATTGLSYDNDKHHSVVYEFRKKIEE